MLGSMEVFLEGTRINSEIWTDHKNLEHFMTS